MTQQAIRLVPAGGVGVPRLALTVPPTNGSAPPARRLIPSGGQAVLSEEHWRAVAASLRLSPREVQIVQAVFDDLKESAIAGRLGISAHTVHTHLERLYRKVGVNSRATMIVRVFAEHLRLQHGR